MLGSIAARNHKHFKDQAARWYQSYVRSQAECERLEARAMIKAKGNKLLAKQMLTTDPEYDSATGDRSRDVLMMQTCALMGLLYK